MGIQVHKTTKAVTLLFALLAPLVSTAQYCSTSYTSSQCSSFDMYIQDFSTTGGVTNITNNSSGCGNTSTSYIFYNNMKHAGVQGTTVNFSVKIGAQYAQGVKIWVDFNGDSDFADAGENVYTTSSTLNPSGSATGSFTIPANATVGQTRMRVRSRYFTNTISECGAHDYGEVEDYVFEIIPSCSVKFEKRIDATSFACAGGDGSITVNVSNGDKYQWQISQNGIYTDLANGLNYSDVDKQTLKLHNTPANMAGAKFRCMVVPTCGVSGTKESDTVELNIRPDIKTETQMLTDTTCIGVSTTLSFKASDEITSSRWQMKSGASSEFEDITSPLFTQNDDNLIINPVQDTLNGAIIRCTYSGICGTETTKDIVLSVNPLPTVITPPADITVKSGATTYFNVEASGVNVRYIWQAGTNGSYVNINNNAIYSGVRTDRLKVSSIARAQDGFQFRCIVSGTGSCAVTPDTSDFAILSVEPPVSIAGVNADNNITIYPSPATQNDITIRVQSDMAQSASSYIILDKLGKKVINGKIAEGGNTKVNVAALSADIYFIQVFDNSNSLLKSIKFIRQ